MGKGRFERGNTAAAKPNRKAVAAMIKRRLEKDDSLSAEQFTTLVTRFDKLTAKRQRRHLKNTETPKKPEAEKLSGSAADKLTGEQAEIHRRVLEIEAEEREIRRKELEAKQPELEAKLMERDWTGIPPSHGI